MPPQNKTRRLGNMVMSNFQRKSLECKIESFFLEQPDRRKLTVSVLMGFFLNATLCLNTWVASTTSVPVKEYVLLPLRRIINVVAIRERERERERERSMP